ncbi:hypothetical protein [Ammoniphilus sp. YIM 78166]|uniref:hypothetical protein n=1 Tax=Ammoniphilus sp. YIM 78166 TaxID=1644106 RepID=UPI00143220DA|nr:hypothetical protein [Ammoniphilus sp. YIM 78166]
MYTVNDIEILIETKEKLKDNIMDSSLNWRERMDLYQSIQGINAQIQKLSSSIEQRPSA